MAQGWRGCAGKGVALSSRALTWFKRHAHISPWGPHQPAQSRVRGVWGSRGGGWALLPAILAALETPWVLVFFKNSFTEIQLTLHASHPSEE